MILTRGNIYWVDLGYGEKPFLVVSNNARNRALKSAIVARITTSEKPPLESIVKLSSHDPLVGRVLCDDLETIDEDEVLRHGGALSLHTMQLVDRGLRTALALR